MTLNRNIPSRKADGVAVANTCSQFACHGFDVNLVLPRGMLNRYKTLPPSSDFWQFYGVEKNFHIHNILWPFRLSFPVNTGFTLMAVLYAIIRDSAIVYSRHIELAWLAALAGRFSIFESHNYSRIVDHPLLPKWVKLFQSGSQRTGMVVTTHTDADEYQRRGIPQQKILVAHNGVNLDRFVPTGTKTDLRKSLGLPDGNIIVCYSGHLYEEKGSRELLECASQLDSVFFLIVGGEVEDIDRCQAWAKKRNLTNLKFAGFVQQVNVSDYLLASDILLMPQSETPCSTMKLFDYLATGRPIVATDHPTIREVLHHKRNAVLVKPKSGRELMVGIKWLIGNPATASKLGEQAGQDAEQYTWPNRIQRIVNWLKGQFHI